MPGPEAAHASEAAYEEVEHLFLHPAPPRLRPLSLLLLTVPLFLAALVTDSALSSTEVVMITAALVLHELGHAVTMRLCGYEGVRVFFIPFLGAATIGHGRGVARWKQGLVLIMGPMPGILLGFALEISLGDHRLAHQAATVLLVINGFNLLPVLPLDGGRLFSLLFDSRHPRLEAVFDAIAVMVFLALGVLAKLWPFVVLAFLWLSALPSTARKRKAAGRLRPLSLVDDPARLDERQRRALFDEMRAVTSSARAGSAARQARLMEQLLDRATREPVPSRSAAWLFATWLLACALTGVGVFWR